ncbi:MAG: peptide chain release factor 2 [Firmicutes bacterium]|nr:peptide chain release factor 2 [Bacillota bacterium]MBQ3965100.1 peptide chain release factor 2 [Bacillota bacterium]
MLQLDAVKLDMPEIRKTLGEVGDSLDLAGMKTRLDELNEKIQEADFWNDQKTAQKVLKEKKHIEDEMGAYEDLEKALSDLDVLIEMAEEEEDESLLPEIEETKETLEKDLEAFRIRTLLSGEYDDNNAILSVHGGSGGNDAKDWAEMLYRMYTRWAAKKGYKVKVLDYQDDEEAGINSATILVEGDHAYGYLKNEKGVHRLVRISPFDSSGRRHTSFASVDVTPEIDDTVEVEIDPQDIRIDTYRSSGAGGQHVNKTDSAIRITHYPTNIVVTCQNERSQHQNKEQAMKILMSRLIELKEREKLQDLKDLQGDYSQITWGSQIRSYVFQPYTLVKDHRTGAEIGNVQAVMDGDIDLFIDEMLKSGKEADK